MESQYEFDVPVEAKIVKDIDTGELYAKFQEVNIYKLDEIFKELDWKGTAEYGKKLMMIYQSRKSYSSGRYDKYRVVKFFRDDADELVVATGVYERKKGEWEDNVKFSKPKPISMIRWMKIDKYSVTIKMKMPVEVKTVVNR